MEIAYKNDLDLLVPVDGDVYLVAYPKAGITWVTELVTAIYKEYAKENPDTRKEFLGAVRSHAFCDACPMSRRSSSATSDNGKPLIGFDENGNETFEDEEGHTKRKRIVSLHFPYQKMSQFVPDAFENNNVKIIYVSRNPKDTAVSYYHFHNMNSALPTPDSWKEFLDDFEEGNVRWGSWFDHVKEWWEIQQEMKRKNKSNMLWLPYETLKRSLKVGIQTICNHLDLRLSEKGLMTVYRRCSFASMKKDPSRNHSKNDLFTGDFLRKGTVGDWENLFTVAQSRVFDVKMKLKFGDEFESLNDSFAVD